ncbi:Alpha/Beta hydrolase protein [Phaeosphaeriaceae sp. PMI808]|nr:Alpha/Beta hydrolase protein [Phaeosphaeriaceae sp. PMI808]
MADTNLSKLNQKTIQVPRGFMYTYYTSPASHDKPTLILFHGWPDTAKLWANAINNYLLPSGYGIIAVDILGFGGTSKPTSHAEYGFHHLAADAVAILDAEKIPTAISVGHDWGSGVAQRFYNFFPARVSGLAMLNFSYLPPHEPPFEMEAWLGATRKAFGYGAVEYWKFFAEDDTPRILRDNIESIYAAAHGSPESWLDTFCAPDGMRNFVTSGKTQPLEHYAGGPHKAEFMERMAHDGFEAPSCYYKAYVFGTQNESNSLVLQDNAVVKVCRPEMLQRSVEAGLLPNLTCKLVDEGHWALLARPERFGEDLIEWLKENFGTVRKTSL